MEDMTLVAAGPRSPTIKVEHSATATWSTSGELDDEIGRDAAAAAAGGSSRRRGGHGVPKRCSKCRELKNGGCACVMTKAKGK